MYKCGELLSVGLLVPTAKNSIQSHIKTKLATCTDACIYFKFVTGGVLKKYLCKKPHCDNNKHHKE